MIIGNEVIRRRVLVDLGSGEGVDGREDGSKIQAIHPLDALTWVANGQFADIEIPNPVQTWYHFALADDGSADRQLGRQDLAAEMLSSAVASGLIRIALIEGNGSLTSWSKPSPKLSIIEPDELSTYRAILSFDDGPTIFFEKPSGGGEDDEEAYAVLEDFFFLWEDVVRVRPPRNESEQSEVSAPLPTAIAFSTDRDRPLPRKRTSRGPKTAHGGPIARFIARCVADGFEERYREKDLSLGRRLMDEYEALGLTPPSDRNAEESARSALREWRKMTIDAVG